MIKLLFWISLVICLLVYNCHCDGEECKRSRAGVDYDGQTHITASGITCQAWTSQYPHRHNLTGDNNYCRNPNNRPDGPWCYTLSRNKEWEYCNITMCPKSNETHRECKTSKMGTDYFGQKSRTTSGITCQAWGSNYPHRSDYSNQDNNYCRNPNNRPDGPWCYTLNQNIEWEYCNITMCPRFNVIHRECKTSQMGTNYFGQKSRTTSGITCQPWGSHYPHRSAYINQDNNYCRNPNNRPDGPWCYTLNQNIEWEYCDIPLCSGSAIKLPNGSSKPSAMLNLKFSIAWLIFLYLCDK